MLSHVFVGVSDFDRALRFYSAVMSCLGHTQRFCEPARPWAGWQSAGGQRPFFVIAHPHDGEAHQAGNGQMTALMADSRAAGRSNELHWVRPELVCEVEFAEWTKEHVLRQGTFIALRSDKGAEDIVY